MGRFHPHWVLVAAGLALAGCAATGPDIAEPNLAAETPAAAASVGETAPAAPVVDVYVPPDPTQVVGMAYADIRRLLGEPSLVRNESTAEVWQYRTAGCVFDLFLYRNGQPDRREVVYFEARDVREGRRLSETAARYCFGHIIRA